MKCKDCAYFEKAYVHSEIDGYDFGMRNYGPGMCRLHGKAVWDTDKACTRRNGCESCVRHKRVYTKGENDVYTDTGHIVCMIRAADVSRRKCRCIFYLPKEGNNGSGGTDGRDPELRRFIPDAFFILSGFRWSIKRIGLRLRSLFGH